MAKIKRKTQTHTLSFNYIAGHGLRPQLDQDPIPVVGSWDWNLTPCSMNISAYVAMGFGIPSLNPYPSLSPSM